MSNCNTTLLGSCNILLRCPKRKMFSANSFPQLISGATLHPFYATVLLLLCWCPSVSFSTVRVVCVHLTPDQQGSSFLPDCPLLLSSFTSRFDHQPCKEDLWLEHAEYYVLRLATYRGAPWTSCQQVNSMSHKKPAERNTKTFTYQQTLKCAYHW